MADKGGYIGRSPSDSFVRIARQSNTVSGVTTTFTFSSGYDVGFLDVYLNGSKLVVGSDYTALDKQTVTLTIPAQNNDSLEFVAYKSFNLIQVTSSSDGDFSVGGSITAVGNIVSNGTIQGTYIGDGSQLTGIINGVGIQSGGTVIGYGATTLNFVGAGNSISYNSGTKTVDINIAGSGGGGTIVADAGDFNSGSSTAGSNTEINGGEFT